MKLIRDLAHVTPDLLGGAVTVGNFDGVHKGHVRIVERLMVAARAVVGPSVVFTFDPHPVRLLRPDQCPPPLTWTDRKAELLGELGVDALIAYPTDQALLELSAREFFERIIRQGLGARAMVEGPNFCFGHQREGNIDLLGQLAAETGLRLDVVDTLIVDGATVSSSRVRTLVAAGDVAAAASLLTRPYRIRGMVTHGAGRGAAIGFPTANVDAIDTLLPGHGVYAGVAHTGGSAWPAAINLGPSPTFGEKATKVEAHLIGFDGALHGQPLEVDFLDRLRDIRRFEDVAALQQQLKQDVAKAASLAQREMKKG